MREEKKGVISYLLFRNKVLKNSGEMTQKRESTDREKKNKFNTGLH